MKSLSILIPSLESRRNLLSQLVCGLIQQCGVIKLITSFCDGTCTIIIIGFENVEIITATDSKQISTGSKRNLLLNLANNDYVVSIDDDDEVALYYVEEVLKAIQSGVDCVATNGTITTNGVDEMQWFLSKDFQNVTTMINGKYVYLRTANHLTPVRRELALMAKFPDKSNAEDKGYSQALNPLLKTEVKIDKPLYHYKYSTTNKEYT